MTRIRTSTARKEFGATLDRVARRKLRVVLHRRGVDVAALVPVEDLELLERLIEAEEDRQDVEDARKALAAPGEDVTLEQLKAELGL